MANNFNLFQKQQLLIGDPKLQLSDLKDPLMRLIRVLFEQEQYGALCLVTTVDVLRDYFIYCDKIWQKLGYKLTKHEWSNFGFIDPCEFTHYFTAMEYNQAAPRYGFNIYGVSKCLKFINWFNSYNFNVDSDLDVLFENPEFDINTMNARFFKRVSDYNSINKILKHAPHGAPKIIYDPRFMTPEVLQKILARGCNPNIAAEFLILDYPQYTTFSLKYFQNIISNIAKYYDFKDLYPKLLGEFPALLESLDDTDASHYIQTLCEHGFNPFDITNENNLYITEMLDIIYELETRDTDPLDLSTVKATLYEFITIHNNWSCNNRQFENANETPIINYLLHKDDNVIFTTPLHILLPYEIKELIIRDMFYYEYELDENYESEQDFDEDELEYYSDVDHDELEYSDVDDDDEMEIM